MNNLTKKDIIEIRKGGFSCVRCKTWVNFSDSIGTRHRNHCPYCLWSQHVDDMISGDRKADCMGNMRPIGITLKEEGADKYGREKHGDVMIIHGCEKCGKISINRIAADDDNNAILSLLDSEFSEHIKNELKSSNIVSLNKNDIEQIRIFLVGRQIGL